MYAFTQDLPITTDVYARIMEGLGSEPPAGCLVHAVARIEGGLRYIDVWESKAACDLFLEQRVHPLLHSAFAASGAGCRRSRSGTSSILSTSTCSRANVLVSDGLASYRSNPNHRRAQLLCLTPEGREDNRLGQQLNTGIWRCRGAEDASLGAASSVLAAVRRD
jgi:hypothetical protein